VLLTVTVNLNFFVCEITAVRQLTDVASVAACGMSTTVLRCTVHITAMPIGEHGTITLQWPIPSWT